MSAAPKGAAAKRGAGVSKAKSKANANPLVIAATARAKTAKMFLDVERNLNKALAMSEGLLDCSAPKILGRRQQGLIALWHWSDLGVNLCWQQLWNLEGPVQRPHLQILLCSSFAWKTHIFETAGAPFWMRQHVRLLGPSDTVETWPWTCNLIASRQVQRSTTFHKPLTSTQPFQLQHLFLHWHWFNGWLAIKSKAADCGSRPRDLGAAEGWNGTAGQDSRMLAQRM